MLRLFTILSLLLCPMLGAQSFQVVNVVIDTNDKTLTAWQVELQYNPTNTSIVGIEAGVPNLKPPRHDRKGLNSGRIVLADFTTKKEGFGNDSPIVATVHLATRPASSPEIPMALPLTAAVMTAIEPGGGKIPVKVRLVDVTQRIVVGGPDFAADTRLAPATSRPSVLPAALTNQSAILAEPLAANPAAPKAVRALQAPGNASKAKPASPGANAGAKP